MNAPRRGRSSLAPVAYQASGYLRFSTRPKGQSHMVAPAIRTIFAQLSTGQMVRDQIETVALMLQPQLPAVATILRDAKEEITAFADCPDAHWRKVWRTNPLERLKRGQTPNRRCWDLPQPRSPTTPGHLRADRDPRRLAGRRMPLPIGGIHGPAHPASPDRNHCDQHQNGGDRHRHDPHGIVQPRLHKPQSITRNELHHNTDLIKNFDFIATQRCLRRHATPLRLSMPSRR